MLFSEKPVGFVGERKAITLLLMAFYVAFYGLMALLTANAPPDYPELRAWWPFWSALCAYYGVGFFALGAEWFWARWFAIGLGYSGLTLAGWVILMERTLPPVLLFYGATHGLIALALQGEKMVALFDAKPGWRERLHLDEAAVVRVGQSVTRGTASLLTLIMVALVPRQPPEGALVLLAAAVGLYGVLRLRTWGVLVLTGAGAAAMVLLTHAHLPGLGMLRTGSMLPMLGWLGGLFLLSAGLPFVRPIARHLAGR